MNALWVLAFVLAVALLLVGEARGARALVLVAKPAASLLFLAVGLARWHAGDTYGAWIVLGLGLSVLGDVLLMFASLFPAGLVAFLLAHVAYLGGFHSLLPAARWPVFLAAPVLAVSVLVARWLWPHLGPLRPAVVAYIAAITLMVWGALAVVSAGSAPLQVLAGAALFYASDVSVARDRFVAKGFVNRAWGLPVYYLAQALLAASVSTVPF